MRNLLLTTLLALTGACNSTYGKTAPALAHDVYFVLKEPTPTAIAALEDGCLKLAALPEVRDLWVGSRAAGFDREVNDKSFHVALHVVFDDTTAHDRYMESAPHQELLAEFGATFAAVTVFDSWVRRR